MKFEAEPELSATERFSEIVAFQSHQFLFTLAVLIAPSPSLIL